MRAAALCFTSAVNLATTKHSAVLCLAARAVA
jgi:hypothetical protein